ncbi:MAG: hypothetical protein IJ121_05150 [Eubacterium sp.]|nr:hypothetical protein [Eubacterium sp.]
MKMRKRFRQMMLMLLVGVMLTGSAVPALAEDTAAEETAAADNTAEEETIPTITLKKQKFTQKTSTAKKKAKAVEPGETIVKMPAKGMGYLKFTAPKKGSYKFIFSDLKKKKGTKDGYVILQVPKNKSAKTLIKQKVKTWGGSTYSMWLGIKNKKYGSNKAEWTRKTRNTKIKMKKGETVYIFFSFAAKDTLNMKIAKV